MLLCIPLGAVYRAVLHPKNVSPELRLVVSLVWGFMIGWICFGRYANVIANCILFKMSPHLLHKLLMYYSCYHGILLSGKFMSCLIFKACL